MVNRHLKHPHRLVWLVIALVIFGAAAGYVGVVEPNLIPDAFSNGKDKISDVIGLGESQESSRVSINAELELRAFDADYPVKVLSIDFINPITTVKVNSESLDLSGLSSGTLLFENWNGRLTVSTGISLDGEASKLAVNSVAILPEKESLAINTKELSFSLAKLAGLSISKFSYTSSGKISINNGQITATLDDETIDLEDFEGNIELTPENLILNGTVSNIEVAGKTLSTSIK